VNECLSNSTCDANATCNNTEGSYTCTCDSGYSGDGISCDGMHCTKVVITTRNTALDRPNLGLGTRMVATPRLYFSNIE
jgi:hypothetical protein